MHTQNNHTHTSKQAHIRTSTYLCIHTDSPPLPSLADIHVHTQARTQKHLHTLTPTLLPLVIILPSLPPSLTPSLPPSLPPSHPTLTYTHTVGDGGYECTTDQQVQGVIGPVL